VTAPILTHTKDAEFSDSGRRAHIAGLSIVSIVIDSRGVPQHIRSVLPLGYGMDEQAVKALEQYRFQPSKLQGKPVPVQITIEVRFNMGS
jgi:protein TonB